MANFRSMFNIANFAQFMSQTVKDVTLLFMMNNLLPKYIFFWGIKKV